MKEHMIQTSLNFICVVTFFMNVIQFPSSWVSLLQAQSNMINVILACVSCKGSLACGQHGARPRGGWSPFALYPGDSCAKMVCCGRNNGAKSWKNSSHLWYLWNTWNWMKFLHSISMYFLIKWRASMAACLMELLWESNDNVSEYTSKDTHTQSKRKSSSKLLWFSGSYLNYEEFHKSSSFYG